MNASPNPAVFGQAVTLTASVSPISATGKVTFFDGPTILGLAPVTGGTATLITRQISAGHQSLSARYDGDGSNGTAASAPFSITVNTASGGGLTTGQSYSTGLDPCCVVSADFNGDGKLDTALIAGQSQSGYILLGNGDGTFRTPITFAAGASPISVATGDFNGDGKLDLAVANVYDSQVNPAILASVSIFLGNGDGTFQAPIVYTTSQSPYALVVGDFNNDGLPDVAMANESYSDVSVYFGNGDGTLRAPAFYTTGATSGAVGLAIGDFNRDGFTDIAVEETNIYPATTANVVLLIGSANGTFTVGQKFPAGNSPNGIQAADLNGDGFLDLVVADYGASQVGVLLGNGNATFQPLVGYAAQGATSNVVISDFNGDGKLDIAASNYETGVIGSVSLLFGNGDGTFQAAQNFNAGAGPNQMAIGDFNGDGLVDLAVADLGNFSQSTGGLIVLLGGCTKVTPTAPLAYDANGGSATFTITATNPSCTWTATSPVPWITLAPASGSGSGTVTATIQPYSAPPVDPADRTATIAVAAANVSVQEDFTVQQFTDVPPASYQFDAVNLLKSKNITAGCSPTDFCPAQIITRDQMAIFIVRSVYGGDGFTISPTQHFADVSPTTFGYMWIQKMYELGITAGCGGGNYCPTEQVTRDQMAVFIIRARYGATTAFTYSQTPYFTDVPNTDFAFQWVQRMKQDNITAGCGPTLYCPGSPVVRGDMAVFIMRGAFNQLLPSTQPIITSVSPATLTVGGTATFTVNGLNTNFVQGTTTVVSTGGDVAQSLEAANVTVVSPTQLTVSYTANPAAPAQPEAVYVQTGAEEAVEPNAIVVSAP